MASDTDIKKTKPSEDLPRSRVERLMDVYWGGTERRITGLTLRIMGINALSVLILMIAIVSFGQFETSMINDKLERFHTQAALIAKTLHLDALGAKETREALRTIKDITGTHSVLFNRRGALLAQSGAAADMTISLGGGPAHNRYAKPLSLTKVIMWVANLLPNRKSVPAFPTLADGRIDITSAMSKRGDVMQAWGLPNGAIILTTAVPVSNSSAPAVIYFLQSGQSIVDDIQRFWQQVFRLFLITLIVTVAISIYLSGTIARPLRRLARSAEAVRRHKPHQVSIPDMSDRHDEIGELSQVMRSMTEALWSRLDAIQSFAADVSHELKNPLTSMKSALETLAYAKDQKAQDKLLAIMHHDIERMDRLISDVSRASRLDAALMSEEAQQVNLEELLINIIDRYRSHYGAQYHFALNIKFGDSEHIIVRSNEGRLMQVFENLLDNAISFSPDQTTISVSMRSDKSTALIHVEDEGTGIADGAYETIFERFYSERRHGLGHRASFGQHSGLGLAIVRQIIEAMNGSIRAVNRHNSQGARFMIRLPVDVL